MKIKIDRVEKNMSVTWITGFNPEMIATEIDSKKKIQKDGSVAFEGFGFKQYETIIHSMLKYPREIPEVETLRISWQAIIGAGKKGKITAKALLSEANKLSNSYLALPILRFVLSTSISISNQPNSMPLRETRINGSKIVFQSKLPKKYAQASAELLRQAKSNIFGEYPRDYTVTQVYVTARTVYEAANISLDAIDLTRGIWNLYINQQHSWRMSLGGAQKPVNEIILGPIHILHHPGGKVAVESWWYEPQYVGPIAVHKFKNAKNANQFFHKTKLKLSHHPYKSDIESAITRYTRALDDRNLNGAFLKLWSVLEFLTDTGKESYDVTIKRASFMFQDRVFDEQILRVLREYRNSSIHLDFESREIETYLYQLKFYIEALIRFHLWNKSRFTSLKEAASLLNLPTDEKILNERISMLRKAKKFLHYK